MKEIMTTFHGVLLIAVLCLHHDIGLKKKETMRDLRVRDLLLLVVFKTDGE